MQKRYVVLYAQTAGKLEQEMNRLAAEKPGYHFVGSTVTGTDDPNPAPLGLVIMERNSKGNKA